MLYLQYESLELTGGIFAYLGKLKNPSIINRLLSKAASPDSTVKHSPLKAVILKAKKPRKIEYDF
jgi:hypothetical protein